MPSLSPLQRRIESLQSIHERIDSFLEEVLNTPNVYREDVIDEMEEAIARLRNGARIEEIPLPKPIEPIQPKSPSPVESESDENSNEIPVRDRVAEIFRRNNNKAMTFQEIAEALGTSDRAIQTLFYKRSYGQFRKYGSRTSPHTNAPSSLWNMTDLGLQGGIDYAQEKPSGIAVREKKSLPVGTEQAAE